MKRNKITAVILSFVMSMSMLMPSIEVLADETSAPSETQKTETTETSEPKSTEKQTPKATEKPAAKETDKPEVKETAKQDPMETEKTEPKETEMIEPKETQKQITKETEKSSVKETEKQEPEITKETIDNTDKEVIPTETLPPEAASRSRKNGIVASGTCGDQGDNITWSVDDDGTLTITGEGKMVMWNSASSVPWYDNRSIIKKVIISKGITYIGRNSFNGYSNLTSVVIPDTVTQMGGYVFKGCIKLSEISIPNSMISIGQGVFSGCISLTSVTIPDSVTDLQASAFNGCTEITSVTLPKNLTTISSSLFSGCTKLKSIAIPESVTSIGSSAFSKCTGLTNVVIPNSVTTIQASAFSGCTGITSVTLPKNLTTINSSLFSGCSKLTNISIPDSVTTIGSSAFSNCSSLTSLSLPKNIMTISDSLFSGCTKLNSIKIPDNVASIGKSAFSGCSSITSISIPSGVVSIGSNAFYKCSGLTNLEIPDSVTVIQNVAFSNCTGLKYIKLSKNISAISDSLFSGCSSLTSISIPEGVTSIGKSAFSGCSSITSIIIPKGVTSIGSSAFSKCSGITEISIPNGVSSIEASCFYNCSLLKSITIPASVTSIGESAFRGCSKLTDIYYNGTNSEWNNISISSNNTVVQNSIVQCGYYSIIIGEVNNGTVTVSKSKACAGDEITVTATPNTGYLISTINYNNEYISGGKFIMPAEDVIITAIFKKSPYDQTEYTITVSETTNGKASVSKEKAYEGDIITIVVTPNNGYTLDAIKVNGNAISGNTFTMDAENATVTVTFKKIEYTVTVSETINGTVTVNKTKACINDEITITATPAEGYELDTIKVNGNAISGNTFTMDAENATVTVTFKKIEYTVTVSETINGTVTVNKTKACIGDEIIITATPAKGYELDSIKAYGTAINDNRFTMLAGSVTVTVTFKKIEYKLTANISEGILSWNKIECADHYWIEVYDSNYNTDTESTKNNTLNLNKLIDRAIKEETIEKCDTYKVSIIAYSYEYDEELGEFSDVFIADCELSYDYDSPAEPITIGTISGVVFSNGKISWDNYPSAVKYEIGLIEDRGETIAEKSLTANVFEVYKWIDGLIESREIFKGERFSYALYAYDDDGAKIAEWHGEHAYNSDATPKKLPSIAKARISGDFLTWEEYQGADHYIVRVVSLSGDFLWGFPQSCTYNLKKEIAELVDEWGMEESSVYTIELYAQNKDYEYLAEWIGVYPGVEYTITVSEATNGTVIVPQTKACVNEEITITTYPVEGYEVDTIKVNGKPISGNVFAMPAENVVISATFKKLVASGKCGDNLSWFLDSKGKLTISGSGEMYNWESDEVPWRKYNSKILTVSFSGKVTSIGWCAFEGCKNLKSVIVPSSVKTIGYCAFCACERLTDITLQDGVKTIGEGAFYGCYGLKNIILPNSIDVIEDQAFSECKGLTSITIPGNVLSISDAAFADCANLKSVTLLHGIASIGEGAFSGCKTLKNVYIPASITTIDKDAFNDCPAFTDVYYSGAKSDWDRIVIQEGNSKLINATLHYSHYLITLNKDIAYGNATVSKTSASAGEEITILTTSDNGYELYSIKVNGRVIDGITFIMPAEDVNIEVIFKKIGQKEHAIIVSNTINGKATVSNDKAIAGEVIIVDISPDEGFELDAIKVNGRAIFENNFTMPDDNVIIKVTFKEIDKNEYTITISDTVNGQASVSKEKAFVGEEITVNISPSPGYALDTIKVNDEIINGDIFAMPGKNVIVYVTFKKAIASGKCGENLTWSLNNEGVLTITGSGKMYDWDFEAEAPWIDYRTKIERVFISDSVETIGSCAFWECTNLSNITIPKSIQQIGESSFFDCTSLQSVTIPSGVSKIGDRAFCLCSSLTSITIPKSISYIDEATFCNCTSLKSVTIIYGKRSIAGVTFYDGVSTIAESAFEGCIRLRSITIPESVRYIEESAFSGTGLITISLPVNVNYIGESAFADCKNLGLVTISEGTRSIRAYAFGSCSHLRTVYIPKSILYIGENAFGGCSAFSDIYYIGTKSDWNRISIDDENDQLNCAAIHYTGGPTSGKCGDNLTWSWNWNGTLTISGIGAMYDFDNSGSDDDEIIIPWWDYSDDIKKVVINDGVTSIGNSAFYNCYNLTEVSIPNSLTSIGCWAFYSTGIESISIPGCVKTIKDGAFQFSALKNVILSDGVTTIGEEAFAGCEILSITIPKSVKIIGYGFFGIVDEDEGNSSYGRIICRPQKVYFDGTEDEWNQIIFDPDDEKEYTPVYLADGSIIRGKNTLWTQGKTTTLKYKKLKKKKQTVSRTKVITIGEPQGKVTYKLASVSKKKYKKYFKVNASNGTVTVKKKLKKGTYTIKVKVTAAGNTEYTNTSKTVSFKIKVK